MVGITLAILAERSSTEAAYDEFKDTGIGLMLPSSAVLPNGRYRRVVVRRLSISWCSREGGRRRS